MSPRQEARMKNEKRYIGPDCPRQHGGERWVSSARCVQCQKESDARKDPERQRQAVAKWQAANREHYNEYQRNWYRKKARINKIGKWADKVVSA